MLDVLGVARHGAGHDQQGNDRRAEAACVTVLTRCTRRAGRYFTNRSADHANRLRPPVLAAAQLVKQRLAFCWLRAITWKRRDVNEDLSATMCWRDEAKAAFSVPRSENARELHEWRLSFDMSGGQEAAKLALARPLDGGVRRQFARV